MGAKLTWGDRTAADVRKVVFGGGHPDVSGVWRKQRGQGKAKQGRDARTQKYMFSRPRRMTNSLAAATSAAAAFLPWATKVWWARRASSRRAKAAACSSWNCLVRAPVLAEQMEKSKPYEGPRQREGM